MTLLRSEFFEYAEGTDINTASGGFGWSNAWGVSNPASASFYVDAGAVYAPLADSTTGSALFTGTYDRVWRDLYTTTTSPTTVYLSGVAERVLSGGNAQFGIASNDFAYLDIVGAEINPTTEMWEIRGLGSPVSTGVLALVGAIAFLVLKFEYDGAGNVTISLFVNPATGGSEPVTPDAQVTAAHPGIRTLHLGGAYNGTVDASRINSIRFADTWEDATPANAEVPFEITCLERDGTPVQNVRVYIEAGAGGPATQGDVLMNALTDASGQVIDTHTFISNQPIQNAKCRKSSPGDTLYQSTPLQGSIQDVVGFVTTATMVRDE